MSQAARPPEAGEFGLAWPGEPTGLAGLASWLQAGPGTTLDGVVQLFAVLVAARQLRTALFALKIRNITHTEAFSPAYTLGYRG